MPIEDEPIEGESEISSSSAMASLVEYFRQNPGKMDYIHLFRSLSPSGEITPQANRPEGIPSEEKGGYPTASNDDTPANYPDVLLQAELVHLGPSTSDGRLITGVSVAWFEIIRQLAKDSKFLFQIPPRKLEELIAGAYERAGFTEVILTPRSGDLGRDIIATRPGFYSIRIIDQVKAYRPGHRVSADEVRALLGVLSADQNASKGLVTTTSEFAPKISEDRLLKPFMPHRLELKNGKQLAKWLIGISAIHTKFDNN